MVIYKIRDLLDRNNPLVIKGNFHERFQDDDTSEKEDPCDPCDPCDPSEKEDLYMKNDFVEFHSYYIWKHKSDLVSYFLGRKRDWDFLEDSFGNVALLREALETKNVSQWYSLLLKEVDKYISRTQLFHELETIIASGENQEYLYKYLQKRQVLNIHGASTKEQATKMLKKALVELYSKHGEDLLAGRPFINSTEEDILNTLQTQPKRKYVVLLQEETCS
jgi:hypothetical protein